MVAMKSRSSLAVANRDAAADAAAATPQSERMPDSTTPESLRGMKSTLTLRFRFAMLLQRFPDADCGFRCFFFFSEWIANYKAKRPGIEVLQRQIDQWMADYDARELQVGFWTLLRENDKSEK